MNEIIKMPSESKPHKNGASADERKPNSVEAIKVAIRILDEMALARRAMRITELADALGETKPRIHRHLATLKEMGIVEQEQSTERYRLGWRLFQLGEAAGAQFDLKYRAEPYLIKLRDELKQTAVLAIPINGQPVVIATSDNIYARICISVKPGNRPLPHCSAFGRLMLAYSSEELQQKLLCEELLAETENSLIDRQAVLDRLPLVRQRFYEYAESEMMVGINTIVTPIFRDNDVLAGAIGIVGSVQDIPNPPHPHQIALLQQYSEELSIQLNSNAYHKMRLQK
ncbi:MAG: IclR family transcriptional regulator [Pseudomonadota bacterium]